MGWLHSVKNWVKSAFVPPSCFAGSIKKVPPILTRCLSLAKSLRAKLQGVATISALPVISEHVSSDGTIKWLFDVGGGKRR